MRKRPWMTWAWSVLLLLLILSCGGFVLGQATPTLPWLEPTTAANAIYGSAAGFGVPPTVTPTRTAMAPLEGNPAPQTAPPTAAPPATTAPSSPLPPQPTATPTAVPSATPRPSLRPGPQLVAYTLRQPVLVDGDLADWPAGLPWYDITQVTYGHAYYSGPHDLSGRLRVAWDQDYLYLAWEVIDDVFVQTQRGAYLYEGDSVEILVDTNLAYDFYTRYLDFDDYQIGFSPGNPPGQNPEAWMWYPQSLAGPVLGARVAAQATNTGYTVEVALPWHRLNLVPFPGLDVGFAASISDNDLPGSALQQSLASTSPFRHLTDPTTWGELLLVSREY